MVIFDANGAELVTSVGPDGNVGCPATPPEIEYFVSMIEQTCSDATKAKIGDLAKSLEGYAKIILGN